MKNKRHAIYYHVNFGRNDGPPLYYYHVLKDKLKLDVTHLIPHGDTRQEFGDYDYHWVIDYGEDGLPVDHTWKIPNDGGQKIYVCSDAHFSDEGRDFRFNKAKTFDYVFFNQFQAMREYLGYESLNPRFALDGMTIKDRGKKKQFVAWLPHAGSPDAYPYYSIVKKYDVGFIGHVQTQENYNGMTRVDALDRLFKEFPNFYFGTRNPQKPEANMFEHASKMFAQCRVVLNITAKDDVNMRNFEIASSGSFQLTNWIPTLEHIYEDGKHLATYRDYDEMVAKVRYYLEHEEEREEIAQAGHQHYLNNHTYQHRIERIFECL